MKVYIVLQYWSEEYHVQDVFYNYEDAKAVVDEDLMHFDVVIEREVRGLP